MKTVQPDAGLAGAVTAAEIASQPALWTGAVEIGIAAMPMQQHLLRGTTLYTGCGSTAHLASALAVAHRQVLPTFAWAQPASEVWLDGASDALRAETVVAVSRSGETTETIEACAAASRMGSALIGITTHPDSQLGRICDHAVAVDFAAEESVVQTRSFTSMLLAGLAAQLTAAGRDAAAVFQGVGETGARLIEGASVVTERLADTSLDAVYVLGSGLDSPLACESALKIKEMSTTFAEGFPTLDFRHGPISLADPRAAVLILCGSSAAHELSLAADIENFGAQVFTVGPDTRCTIETPSRSSRPATSVARLVIAQLAGLRRGIAKGLDPDAPRGVTAHVVLDAATGQSP